MYPKPPLKFMPKEGDIITPRDCDLCGYPLAEYRGVIEEKPQSVISDTQIEQLAQLEALHLQNSKKLEVLNNQNVKKLSRQQKNATLQQKMELQAQIEQQRQQIMKIKSWFFCNYEHQNEFHALKNK